MDQKDSFCKKSATVDILLTPEFHTIREQMFDSTIECWDMPPAHMHGFIFLQTFPVFI